MPQNHILFGFCQIGVVFQGVIQRAPGMGEAVESVGGISGVPAVQVKIVEECASE